MTKRQRTFLFLTLLILFFILAPSLALYSQGYRIDLAQGRITQTGAFYVKTSPARADIYIDGNLTKRTDFLFGSGLTKNFFPGNYFVEIAKEGYHSWQKILEIKERNVTEAKNVLLFKKDPAFQTLAANVERFWISPDKKYALLQQRPAKSSFELRLLNLDTGGSEPVLAQAQSQDEILTIQWAPDSARFLLGQSSKKQVTSQIHSILPNLPCFNKPCDLEYLKEDIADIQFSFANSEQILFSKVLNTNKALFAARYAQKELPLLIANNVITFMTHGSTVTWLDANGALWQQDLAPESTPQVFFQLARVPKKETPYTLLEAHNSILLKEEDTVFLYDRNSKELKEILAPVHEVILSPGKDKIALRNQSELWILFLRQENEQPQRRAGELVLLTRFSEPINQLFWVNSSYLIFSLQNSVRAAEIDSRDRLNIAMLAEFQNPELFWDNTNSILYVLEDGAFFVSEKIVR